MAELSDAERLAVALIVRNNHGKLTHDIADDAYAAGKAAGMEEAWARVNAMIQRGCLPGDGWDETAERNGLVLAANAIREAAAKAAK